MGSGRSRSDEAAPIKVTVVDRRHHARDREEGGAPAAERSRYPSVVEELKARTELAERRAREAAERAETEIDAVRERLQRDVDRRVSQGKAGLLASLLEVTDNLDRAARAASEQSRTIGDGIDLIRQQLLSILKAEEVEPIETLGLPYDPNVAEAVAVEAVEVGRDNLVVEEIQRGYRRGATILRPARVKVGRADAGSPAGTTAEPLQEPQPPRRR